METDGLSINLRHLRVLLAIAEAGSLARAAEALFRVPSALTRSVASLEATLGRPLCARGARGTALTPAGRLVAVRAERIRGEFDEAAAQLAARHGVKAAAARSLFASVMDGRRLAVVAELVAARPMRPVAHAVGRSQPAVSAAVRDIEARLGTPLFARSPRGLVATAAGETLALHFRRAVAELRHIVPDLAASEGALVGRVHVGALPLGRTRVLPLAIAALVARHPDLRVATDESPYEALAAALRRGDLDVILGALRPASAAPDFVQEALFVDRIAVIARAGHPLARPARSSRSSRRLGFADLRRAAWVLSRPGAPSRELFDRAFAAARQEPPVPRVETGDLAILRGLLLGSDMLTALSPHQLHHEIRDGSLVVLDVPLEATRRSIGLTVRRGALPSPGAGALLAAIRDTVRGLPELGRAA